MRRRSLVLALVYLMALGLFTEISPAAEFKLPPFITIAAYDIGSNAYMTISMASEGITQHSGQKFRLLPQGTGVARLSALRSGTAQFMCTATETIFASAGREEFAEISWGPQDLRLVWTPAATGIPMFVRGDSGIKKIADLKGKKLPWAVGSSGMNIQITANLAFGGLTWNDVVMVKVPSYTAACEGVISGLVDSYAVAPTSVFTTRLEASPHGIGYIPLPFDDEVGWKRARAAFPFWSKYTATAGGGLSKEKPLQTATYPNPLLTTYSRQDPI